MTCEFRTAYGEHARIAIKFTEPTLAKQADKESVDMNNIIAKFAKTGLIDHQNVHQGDYGEYAVLDYQEALNLVIEAREMFETLPSQMRRQFDNDPGKFIDYVEDPNNRESLYDMGLARRPVQPYVHGEHPDRRKTDRPASAVETGG